MSKSTNSDLTWMISPLSKIPIKCERKLRDKQQISYSQSVIESRKKKIPDFKSLKFDKNDGNPSGCCMSCV